MSLREKIFSRSFALTLKGKSPVSPVTVNNCEFGKEVQIQSQPYFAKFHPHKEMPIYASFRSGKARASYTIEAAVVLPLFITLMLFGMFTFRLLEVQSGVQKSINSASRTMAVTLGNVSNSGESDKDADTSNEDATISGELSEAALLASTIALSGVEIANNKVPIGFVDGGALGFNFLNTTVEGNYIDIQVTYKMTYPIGLLGKYSFDVTQRARNRKWVGYDKAENTTDEMYVFITEKGERYHTNYNCTYLNPSVHRLPKEEIDSARNKGGAKYYVCAKCKHTKAHGFYFITDYGTAYHTDINCTEIKHNIKKVLYEEVKDKMPGCSKCTGTKK